MNKVVLFNDKLPPNFGGMETHFMHALNYFKNDKKWKCEYVVSKELNKHILLDNNLNAITIFENSYELGIYLHKTFKRNKYCMLFNNGMWIEDLGVLKKTNPNAIMCQRTGGNEFMKATLLENTLPIKERQRKWADHIKDNLDFIISNSNYTNRRLLDIGVPENKIVKIRGGVSRKSCEENIANRFVNRKGFDRKYNLNKKEYIITVAARLIHFKGIDTIISAISKSKFRENVIFVCIGDGELKDELLSLCEKFLEKDSYVFMGNITPNETLKLISLSDLYCSASRDVYKKSNTDYYIHSETMGRSILEAICQNIKVVATNVGGVSEWFETENNIGVLVNEDDHISMTKAIDSVLNELVQENYSLRFLDLYSWDVIFEIYKEMWEELSC